VSEKDQSNALPFVLELGDGLTRMSRFPFGTVQRVPWRHCSGFVGHGSDCLAPKGFSLARHELRPGVFLDVYNWHADAKDASRDRDARRAQVWQLIRFILDHSAGHAVLLMGDSNSRYTRPGDILPELLHRTGLRDVWLDLTRGGALPSLGHKLAACDPETASTGRCELVDKIFYRGSDQLELVPLRYAVEGRRFEDAQGRPLSDHEPVSAVFSFRILGASTPGTWAARERKAVEASGARGGANAASQPAGDGKPDLTVAASAGSDES